MTFSKYMGESTWQLSLKLSCPYDGNKGVASKGNPIKKALNEMVIQEKEE